MSQHKGSILYMKDPKCSPRGLHLGCHLHPGTLHGPQGDGLLFPAQLGLKDTLVSEQS